MPLHLLYDSTKPISVLSWLERWLVFLLPKQIFHPKKVSDSKSKKLQCGRQIIPDKLKKNIRRNSPCTLKMPQQNPPLKLKTQEETSEKYQTIQQIHCRMIHQMSLRRSNAKLRAQGFPGSSQDGIEKDNLNRQHSLPASTDRKTSLASPRAQRPVKTSSKGGNRSDRSQISARDGKGKRQHISSTFSSLTL